MKKRTEKIVMMALITAAVITFSLTPLTGTAVFAASASPKTATNDSQTDTRAVTTITGYPVRLNKSYQKSARISATVSPAYGGRTVRLQRYNSATGKWKTIIRTVTDDAVSAKVTFSIPKKYRAKTTSLWRIYVNKTDTAKSARSKKIKLTTRNIKSLKLSAGSACIYRVDENGEGAYLYGRYMNTRRPHASTTKLMTAVLLMESDKIDTVTKISKHAAETPYGSGHLAKGDKFYTRDLLYAMLLPSSNDAATAVAEKVKGSESAFVSLMNARATELGFTRTHYCNPHGLDDNEHYSTAAELAKLTEYAYSFEEIQNCMATRSKTIWTTNGSKSWTLYTTNSIFGYIKNFFGGKTGTTGNAGCCFTGIYKYKGSLYVTVVLGSGYGFSRWSDTQKLHKYIRKYATGTY